MRFASQAHVQARQCLSAGAQINLHYISAWASARDRRFTSIREFISALKYGLHAYGVNFLLDFIFNNYSTGLFIIKLII